MPIASYYTPKIQFLSKVVKIITIISYLLYKLVTYVSYGIYKIILFCLLGKYIPKSLVPYLTSMRSPPSASAT